MRIPAHSPRQLAPLPAGGEKASRRPFLLSLVVFGLVLAIGAALYIKNWKDREDRAVCILNIRNFQTAVRSYASVKEVGDGGVIRMEDLAGSGKLLKTFPVCPSGGIYNIQPNGSVINTTSMGHIFLKCDSTVGGPHALSGDTLSW